MKNDQEVLETRKNVGSHLPQRKERHVPDEIPSTIVCWDKKENEEQSFQAKAEEELGYENQDQEKKQEAESSRFTREVA